MELIRLKGKYGCYTVENYNLCNSLLSQEFQDIFIVYSFATTKIFKEK
jgi:hypothetical protein